MKRLLTVLLALLLVTGPVLAADDPSSGSSTASAPVASGNDPNAPLPGQGDDPGPTGGGGGGSHCQL